MYLKVQLLTNSDLLTGAALHRNAQNFRSRNASFSFIFNADCLAASRETANRKQQTANKERKVKKECLGQIFVCSKATAVDNFNFAG